MSRNNSFEEKKRKKSTSSNRPTTPTTHKHGADDSSDHADHSTSSIKTGTDFSSKYSDSEKTTQEEEDYFSESTKLTGNETFAERMTKLLKRQGQAFMRNFIDYGPPYASKPFDVALINECAKPVLNHFEVHKLLNTKLNPNIPDPEDLYYTPTHW